MSIKKIAFIGAGNMGGSIARGIVKSGFLKPESIMISDYSKTITDDFAKHGYQIGTSETITQFSKVVLIAVKPWHVEQTIAAIKDKLTPEHMIISIAAGVTLQSLETFVGQPLAIFRLIPNTAIGVRESMTSITCNEQAKPYLDSVTELFDLVGKTSVIEEKLMNAATALASCGTAYALRYARATMEAGIELGLKPDVAKLMTAQAIKGAMELLLESGNHPEAEIDKVTTPGGMTIKGLNKMEEEGFTNAVIQGVLASLK